MTNRPLSPGSTIGILGGGQLGRMLALAAARLGLKTHIFEPGADCPAATRCSHAFALISAAILSRKRPDYYGNLVIIEHTQRETREVTTVSGWT